MSETPLDPAASPAHEGEPSDKPVARTEPRVLRSEQLFEGRREVFIEHGRAIYRLRITAQGRLILTK